MTQVTVEVTSNKSHVSFPLSLYRGFVVLGQGANVAVKDSADPSQPLTLRARDITFPVGTPRSPAPRVTSLPSGWVGRGAPPGSRTHEH